MGISVLFIVLRGNNMKESRELDLLTREEVLSQGKESDRVAVDWRGWFGQQVLYLAQ